MNAAQELVLEHAVIMKIVVALKAQGAALSSGQAVPAAQLSETLSLLVDFADKCHHAKEERVLFPELAGLPEHAPAVSAFLGEHERSRGNVGAMKAALPKIESDPASRKNFADNANAYVAILLPHIQKENALFARCGEIFSPAENARMAGEFERIELEEVGEGKHDEYRERAEKLSLGVKRVP